MTHGLNELYTLVGTAGGQLRKNKVPSTGRRGRGYQKRLGVSSQDGMAPG